MGQHGDFIRLKDAAIIVSGAVLPLAREVAEETEEQLTTTSKEP